MSMMGELTFFLGIQVKQTKEGSFVHQTKYTKDLIKKFAMADAKPVSTPMSTMITLDPDEDGEAINQKEYRTNCDRSTSEMRGSSPKIISGDFR
jgi:hypothetical protein